MNPVRNSPPRGPSGAQGAGAISNGIKVCFVFQRRFTPVAHAILLELKKRGVIKSACGYVYLRSSAEFLRQQQDIRYTALLLDEDIEKELSSEQLDWKYLEQLEHTYGLPNLWPYITVDRIIRYGQHVREYPHDAPFYSHEDMARFLQIASRRILAFLETEKPDVVFMPVVSSLGNMLLYHMGKKRGIRVLVGAETRIGGGYALSQENTSFSFAENRFRELLAESKSPQNEAARSYIAEYRKRPHAYHYVMESYARSGSRAAAFAWLSPARFLRSFWWNISYAIQQAFSVRDYSDRPALGFLIDTLRRKARLARGFGDLYDASDEHEPFAYFPLHLEPEMSLLALAPRWSNQVNLIKQIAESLPFSYKLYVKEHPAMVGFRTRSYYKELKKIPNVKLIHPNHNSHSLIRGARLITTITGTVGWEAALLGKPVITFGDVYYNALSTVNKCENIESLPGLVKKLCEHFEPNDDELALFVAALLEHSKDLRLHELWEKGVEPEAERQAIEGFCDLFERYLRP